MLLSMPYELSNGNIHLSLLNPTNAPIEVVLLNSMGQQIWKKSIQSVGLEEDLFVEESGLYNILIFKEGAVAFQNTFVID